MLGDHSEKLSQEEEETELGEEILAILVQAMKGTESNKSVRLRGFWANHEVYMLVDSSSTHCFISEHLASSIQGSRPLLNTVQVRVANGETLWCTHELPGPIWVTHGIPFKTSFKIIPHSCYDFILGMDWLSGHSPMEVHWAEKWFYFNHRGKVVKIQGLLAETVMGPSITPYQLAAMEKQDSILYCVQLHVSSTTRN